MQIGHRKADVWTLAIRQSVWWETNARIVRFDTLQEANLHYQVKW